MEVLIIAAALYFFLRALEALMSLLGIPPPTHTMIVFIFCLLVAIYLLVAGGAVGHLHTDIFRSSP